MRLLLAPTASAEMRDLAADRDLRHFSLNTGDGACPGRFPRPSSMRAARHGISQVSPWRDQVAAVGLDRAVKAVRDGGFALSGYCRGGMFPADASDARGGARRQSSRRRRSRWRSARACLVVVVGGLPQYNRAGAAPSKDIAAARAEVRDGLAELLDYAEGAGMPLALEPLHPMSPPSARCVNTLRQALDLCDELDPERSRGLGVAVDVYHVWWDFEVYEQIERIGRGPAARLPRLRLAGADHRYPQRPRHDGRRRHRDRQAARRRRGGGLRRRLRGRGVVEGWAKRPLDEVIATAIERYRTVC